MTFKTIRDLPEPPDSNDSKKIVPADLLVVCDADGSDTYCISAQDLMAIGLTFSTDTDGLVPGPSASEAGDGTPGSAELLAANGNWVPIGSYPNSKTAYGVVSPGGDNKNKVWKTDGDGNPGWRTDNHTININSKTAAGLVSEGGTNNNTVWKTDNSGNPAWRDDHSVFSIGVSGLVPGPSNNETGEFLRGDGNWAPLTSNTKNSAGVVSAGGSNAHKVWKTDADGNPGWRTDADTNTTYNTFSIGTDGLVPGPSNNETGEFLRGDGNWAPLTSNTKNSAGVVLAGGSNAHKVWKTDKDGNPGWRTDADTNTTYNNATASASGLMSAADKQKLDGLSSSTGLSIIARGEGFWGGTSGFWTFTKLFGCTANHVTQSANNERTAFSVTLNTANANAMIFTTVFKIPRYTSGFGGTATPDGPLVEPAVPYAHSYPGDWDKKTFTLSWSSSSYPPPPCIHWIIVA